RKEAGPVSGDVFNQHRLVPLGHIFILGEVLEGGVARFRCIQQCPGILTTLLIRAVLLICTVLLIGALLLVGLLSLGSARRIRGRLRRAPTECNTEYPSCGYRSPRSHWFPHRHPCAPLLIEMRLCLDNSTDGITGVLGWE